MSGLLRPEAILADNSGVHYLVKQLLWRDYFVAKIASDGQQTILSLTHKKAAEVKISIIFGVL